MLHAFFNWGDAAEARELEVAPREVVRDAWSGARVTPQQGRVALVIGARDAALLRISEMDGEGR